MIIYLVVLPLLGGFAILLLGLIAKRIPIAAPLTILILLATAGVLLSVLPQLQSDKTILYDVGGWQDPVGITLRMDAVAFLGSCLGLCIVFLAAVYATAERAYGSVFYAMLLVLAAAMQGVLLTNDLFNLYVLLEIVSLCTYFLVAYHRKTRSLKAALDYLFISCLGFAFYLFGVGLVYRATGVLGFQSLSEILSQPAWRENPSLSLALALILTGAGVKAVFFPLHTWLPDAHAQAPTPISAILSGVMIKISFLAVWRTLDAFSAFHFTPALMVIGLTSALWGGCMAVVQVDMKRLLACSSICQMGFIITAFTMGAPIGRTAALLHILNHALFKSLLFFCAGIIIAKTGKRDVRLLSGLGRKEPLLAGCLLVGVCSISGVPGFNGFVSKSWVAISLAQQPLASMGLTLAGMLTVASMGRLVWILVGQPAEIPSETQFCKTRIWIPAVFLASLCLLLGMVPWLGVNWVKSALDFGDTSGLDVRLFSIPRIANSLLVLVVGIAIFFALRRPTGTKIADRVRNLDASLNVKLLLVVVAAVAYYLLAAF